MERISIQELAVVLTNKSGLKRKEAERFAMTIFEVVKEGLLADRLVKIKGLGTFKIIDIDSRESVDVNTGERVLIEGHDKITFTADSTMKDLVNRPFSQFDTVILNEGVVFDDSVVTADADEDDTVAVMELTEEDDTVTVMELTEEAAEEEAADATEVEPSAEDARNEPEPEPEPAPEPEPVPEPESMDEPKAEQEPAGELSAEEPTEEQTAEDEEDEEYSRGAGANKYLRRGLAVGACVLSFAVGYVVGHWRAASVVEPLPVDTEAVQKVAVKADSIRADSIRMEPEAGKPEPKAAETVSDHQKYEQMDARVRTGAYRIVGTAQEVKLSGNETASRLSQRFLGPGMECYFEVYNGVKATTELKAGQTVRIPKLELKKKKKKKTNH